MKIWIVYIVFSVTFGLTQNQGDESQSIPAEYTRSTLVLLKFFSKAGSYGKLAHGIWNNVTKTPGVYMIIFAPGVNTTEQFKERLNDYLIWPNKLNDAQVTYDFNLYPVFVSHCEDLKETLEIHTKKLENQHQFWEDFASNQIAIKKNDKLKNYDKLYVYCIEFVDIFTSKWLESSLKEKFDFIFDVPSKRQPNMRKKLIFDQIPFHNYHFSNPLTQLRMKKIFNDVLQSFLMILNEKFENFESDKNEIEDMLSRMTI